MARELKFDAMVLALCDTVRGLNRGVIAKDTVGFIQERRGSMTLVYWHLMGGDSKESWHETAHLLEISEAAWDNISSAVRFMIRGIK